MHEAATYLLVRARRATFESEEDHPSTLEREGNTQALEKDRAILQEFC
jgi:hypothetical protein